MYSPCIPLHHLSQILQVIPVCFRLICDWYIFFCQILLLFNCIAPHATMKCSHLCTSSFEDIRAKDILWGYNCQQDERCNHGHWSVDSALWLTSLIHIHIYNCVFPPSMVLPNMVVFLQYTVKAMQWKPLCFLPSKVFYFCNGGELLYQCFTSLKTILDFRQDFRFCCTLHVPITLK